jgi:heavy metal translocating P-type ATPase
MAATCCCSCGEKPAAAATVARPEKGDGFVVRAAIALVLAGQGMVFGIGYSNAQRAGEAPVWGGTVYWLLHGALIASALAVAALLGAPLARATLAGLRARTITVEFLFSLSLLGAFTGSLVSTISGQGAVYYEIVAILLVVYSLGKRIGRVQRGRVLEAANALRETFNQAWRQLPDGTLEAVGVADLAPGEIVHIHPGEAVPVDGRIRAGAGFVRETALTGEPAPVRRGPGDPILAGTHSVDGAFTVEVTAARARKLDRILATVENASHSPSRLQEQADRIMQWFVPLVAAVSVTTFLVWWWLAGGAWWEALFNAMAVLLVACPCALGLAMPIGVWSGLHAMSRAGLVSRSGRLIDALARCDCVLFDKTGTLTESVLELRAWQPTLAWRGRDAWLRTAVASLERRQSHPVARCLAGLSDDELPVAAISLIPGRGISGMVGERRVAIVAGDASADNGPAGKFLQVEVDGEPAALVTLGERLRHDVEAVFAGLRAAGIEVRILTGDPRPAWPSIAGVAIEADLDPAAKEAQVSELLRRKRHVVFVGDGINDAPALARCPAAIAMGEGAPLARSTADGILTGGRLAPLVSGIAIARRVQARLRGNLLFALCYHGAGIILAATGNLHPVVAALLMTGSSALVSWRALHAHA